MVAPKEIIGIPRMGIQDLRVYQAAEALVAEVDMLLRRLPARVHNTADHLDRSTNSVFFNGCEGWGSYRPKMKASALGIARKEAEEVRGALRSLVLRRALQQRTYKKLMTSRPA